MGCGGRPRAGGAGGTGFPAGDERAGVAGHVELVHVLVHREALHREQPPRTDAVHSEVQLLQEPAGTRWHMVTGGRAAHRNPT